MKWYNGYSPEERKRKLRALNAACRRGEVPPAAGPCTLCGDPDVSVEYHSEDYSEPYRWSLPAMFALCRQCHRTKLHKRFWNRVEWMAHKAHVRRGGYARDLIRPDVAKEMRALRRALQRGETVNLTSLRPYAGESGSEWWEMLPLDEASLTSPASRPRP